MTGSSSQRSLALKYPEQVLPHSPPRSPGLFCPRPTEMITFEEYLALTRISFEWANSYDTKDWPRLQAILTPTLCIDYTLVMGAGKKWSALPAEAFVAMMSGPTELGNPLIATQHFLGGSVWERTSESEIMGTHQLRAAHQRYADDGKGGRGKEVVAKGHGHAVIKHFYAKGEDGMWKLAGLQPTVLFDEFSVGSVFGRG